jgi:hypothetical protein
MINARTPSVISQAPVNIVLSIQVSWRILLSETVLAFQEKQSSVELIYQ